MSLISLPFEQCDLKFQLTVFSNNHQCAEGFQREKTICYHEDFIINTITYTEKGLRRADESILLSEITVLPESETETEAFASPTKALTKYLPSATSDHSYLRV